MKFVDLLSKSMEETKSNVSIGLDLANYGTRHKYTLKKGDKKIEVLLSLIESLSSYCCVFKVNRQYILDLNRKEIQEVTKLAHEYSRPIIIDHKITDTREKLDYTLNIIAKEGFDAFTFSPLLGNVEEITKSGLKLDLASFMLVLMSNPEANWMITSKIENLPLFQYLSQKAQMFSDGAVIGATNHVGERELKLVSREISEKVILVPGIGVQEGNIEKIIQYFKNNTLLLHIGRSIIYNENPSKELQKQNILISKIKANTV